MRETLLGRLALCFFGLVIWSSLGWTFTDLAQEGYCLMAAIYLAVTARTRHVRWITSAGAVVMAVVLILGLTVTLPLQARVHGARFVNAPVAEVLHHIARQKTSAPYWRFYVVDEMTSVRRISVDLPEGVSLREALNTVSRASGCVYRWNWFKLCGNAPRPLYAVFRFQQAGASVPDPFDWVLLIDRKEILPNTRNR